MEKKIELNGMKLEWWFEQDAIADGSVKIDNKPKLAISLGDLIRRVDGEAPLKMVYPGIKQNSVGLVFGPSKCGKTTFAENLLLSIAAGEKEYLGKEIAVDNNKVLIYSMEEYYRNRVERNKIQAKRLIAKYGNGFLDNFCMNDDRMPRYLNTDKDWDIVKDFILSEAPSVTVMDSLTHCYKGSIEDSTVAKEVMERLHKLVEATNTTLILIHHTHKMYDRMLSIDTIAGSRVIAQETDFMIGLNRTANGLHYIKDVAFRYAPCDSDTVKSFIIDDDCCINVTGEIEEANLISTADGRRDDRNKDKMLIFFHEQAEKGNNIVSAKDIYDRFIPGKEMSRQTIHGNLNKLVIGNKLLKTGNGEYKLAA